MSKEFDAATQTTPTIAPRRRSDSPSPSARQSACAIASAERDHNRNARSTAGGRDSRPAGTPRCRRAPCMRWRTHRGRRRARGGASRTAASGRSPRACPRRLVRTRAARDRARRTSRSRCRPGAPAATLSRARQRPAARSPRAARERASRSAANSATPPNSAATAPRESEKTSAVVAHSTIASPASARIRSSRSRSKMPSQTGTPNAANPPRVFRFISGASCSPRPASTGRYTPNTSSRPTRHVGVRRASGRRSWQASRSSSPSASFLKRTNARLWLRVAEGIGDDLVRNGGKHTAGTRIRYALGWLFLYRTLRDRIGMRKVRYAASGAAPIAPEVLKFFMGIGVPMHEVYGMTENTAIATGNMPGRVQARHGRRAARRHRAAHRRRDRRDPDPARRRVRRVLAQPGGDRRRRSTPTAGCTPATSASGSTARTCKITDRMKDIIITAGGKNIAPSEIENALKASAVHQGGRASSATGGRT